MARPAKPAKRGAETQPRPSGKSPNERRSKIRDLEKHLAECLARETKALEQQTATSEILRMISSSPHDIQPVFDAIAAATTRLCAVESAGVYRFDGTLIHFAAHHGWTAQQLDAIARVFPQSIQGHRRGRVPHRALCSNAPNRRPDWGDHCHPTRCLAAHGPADRAAQDLCRP